MRNASRAIIVLTAALFVSPPIAASGGTTPDPNLNDTVLGTTGGVRYATESATYDGVSGYASATGGCGTTRWHLIGGGSASGGDPASAWLASQRPEDYTDGDTVGDDGWLASGYGANPEQFASYSICIRDGDLRYPWKTIADDSTGLRTGSVGCGALKWRVTTGSPFISTTHSWANSSLPTDDGDGGTKPDDGWSADVYDTIGGIGGFYLFAVCAAHVDLRYVTTDPVTVSAGSTGSRRADCRGAEHVVGGGARVTGPQDRARMVSSLPVDRSDANDIPDDGWQSRVYNISGSDKKVTGYAICLG